MMPGYGSGMGGWGFMFMSLGGLIFLALIGLVIWLLVRSTGSNSGSQPSTSGDSAREILAQRYARGEIDEDEYHRRMQALASR